MEKFENNPEAEFLEERRENVGMKPSYGLSEEINIEKAVDKGDKKYTFTKKGLALLMTLCIAVSSAFGIGGGVLASHMTDNAVLGQGVGLTLEQLASLSDTENGLEQATGSKLTVNQIIALTANAVVEIRTEQVANDSWMMQYVTKGAGSGVIISNDGYIMTNNHVISGASKISVTLKNGKEYTASLVGTDSQTDVAVIKINATGLTSVVYGDSDTLKMGDLAVAIGNPLGQLGGTATAGIISSLDRQLTIDGKEMTLLQTDASINPGNSGGGLFNQYGQLIGLVVAKSSGSDVEGLGFAIPINDAKTVASQIVQYGYVKGRVSAGLTLVDLTSMQNAMSYGVRSLGIYVKSADSANAKAAGFEPGDMLYYVGDKKIESMSDVTSALQSHSVGDKIKVTVVRNNELKDLTLTLGEKTQ